MGHFIMRRRRNRNKILLGQQNTVLGCFVGRAAWGAFWVWFYCVSSGGNSKSEQNFSEQHGITSKLATGTFFFHFPGMTWIPYFLCLRRRRNVWRNDHTEAALDVCTQACIWPQSHSVGKPWLDDSSSIHVYVGFLHSCQGMGAHTQS